jgi:hypothetical protein
MTGVTVGGVGFRPIARECEAQRPDAKVESLEHPCDFSDFRFVQAGDGRPGWVLLPSSAASTTDCLTVKCSAVDLTDPNSMHIHVI